MSMIGRAAESAAITAALEGGRGSTGVVVLCGDAGIGKTTLWLAGIAAATAQGYQVLTCRPSTAETRFSYAALADLLDRIDDDVIQALPPVQRRAIEAVLMIGAEDLRADERTVAATFLRVLRLLCAQAPVCVGIDDVQWLDPASLAVIRYALDRLDREPVAVLLAVRGGVPEWAQRVRPDDRRVIEVPGLSLSDLRQLLLARLGSTYPRPMLLRLWESSGGNPLFALELASALARHGGSVMPGEDLPIPSNLQELLRTRLRGLSDAARRVARAAAALAHPTVGLVEAAVGRISDVGLAEAVAAGVLEADGDRLRFAHPLMGVAVTAGQTPSRRRALHARLATLAPSAEERARHLALAFDEPDEGVAAAVEAAAEAARERGAPSTAAELAEQAVRLTGTDRASDRLRRLLLAAGMHRRAGDPGRASDLLTEALADATAGTDRATVLLHLGDTAPSPASIALYEEALAEAALAASPDHALRATIHLRLADSMAWGAGWPGRVRHARLAIQAASRVDDVVLRAVAIAHDCLSRFYAGQGLDEAGMVEAVALERTLPQWPLPEGPTLMYGTQLFWAAEVARAREVLRAVEHAVPSGQQPMVEADLKWFRGFVEWRAGDWDLAERYLTESLDISAQFGEVAPPAEFPVAIIEAHRGQVDAVRARSSRAIGRGKSRGIRIAESGHGWVLGFLELSLGRPEQALIHLRRCYEIRNDFMLEPAQRFELGDLMEALIAVGALDEAGGIIDVWQPRARAVDRAWALAILHRGRAQLLAAGGELDAAFEEFDSALTEHDRSPDPFHRARTLLALGRTQRRARRRAAARSTLDEALAGFGRLGAPLWAEQTRVELARIGGRGAASAGLTESERRIADLVAEGRSNREVADALFLTVHTVETALTRIYRKLGVSSRAGLARLHSANT